MTPPPNGPSPNAARFVGAVFGFVFAAIGVTVIAFLWAAPFGEWDSPPLFFRVFGSLIAVVFVAVGGTIGVTALRAKSGLTVDRATLGAGGGSWSDASDPAAPAGGGGAGRGSYRCPNCAAPLGAGADVSPSGDASAAFCGRWFNVHREG